MNSLAGFFQKLLDKAFGLIPVKIICAWQRGERTRFGMIDKGGDRTSSNGLLGTGVHFYWPVIGSLTAWECNIEVFETSPQRVGDHTFSLLVQCKIDDLSLYFKNVQDELKEAVGDTVRAAASEIALVSDNLDTHWAETVRKLAHTRMRGWGVDIKRVSVATATRTPALHLIR